MDAKTLALLASAAQALAAIVAANTVVAEPVHTAPVAQTSATPSRVEAVALREREQIAEARRLERLYHEGVLSQQQAYDLAWHQIGKKRARRLLGMA